jgi:hypothetical protein
VRTENQALPVTIAMPCASGSAPIVSPPTASNSIPCLAARSATARLTIVSRSPVSIANLPSM